MLTDEGHVKVMDFGLAKQVRVETASDDQSTGSLTDPGVRVGTPGSMAPEQLLGGHVDERSDLFAFGILLYELLAGVYPFTRASPSGTMSAILKETPAPISQYAKDAPESARVTLDRLLAKEPHQRYQSFGDLRTDLGQLLKDASGLTPIPQAADAAPSAADGRTPFVGRETERAEARRMLERAVAGHGGVLLIGGEPGVGKTRLAEEVLAEGRQRGCLSLTGRCYETEGTPPFIPWVEILERSARIVPKTAFREALGDAAPEVAKLVPELRRTFPDIPAPIELPPEQQRRYLFNGFLEFVERASRVSPQVLLIDDLHWADDSTLLLLQHLAEHATEIPLLIVGTYRDVDLEVARPFAKMLEALTRQRLAHKVALRRLSESDVGDMLQALSGQAAPSELVRAIYAETEGNPFFTEEVFQHLSEEGRLFDEDGQWRADLRVEDLEVPEGVRLVIGWRVERLSPDARGVLTTAAIVGRSFTLALLEALGDAKGEALLAALEEAEAAKLIQTVSSSREARWEFAHGLIRQTLEGGLSLVRRQRAHLRVAEAMERAGGANVDETASDLAHHLFQAGAEADAAKTARFLTLAGDQALAAGAFDEALRQFTDALSIQTDQKADQHVVADLRYKKGRALRSLARWDEAIEEWKQGLASYGVLKDRAATARVGWELAHMLCWSARGQEAVEVARAGLEVLGSETTADRSRLLAISALGYGSSAECSDGLIVGEEMLAEALTMAQAVGDPRAHREALFSSAYLHFYCMRNSEAAEHALRAAESLRSAGDLWHLAEMRSHFLQCAFPAGRQDGVAQAAEEAETLGRRFNRMDVEFHVVWSRMLRDWLEAADLDELEESCQQGLEHHARASLPWAFVFHVQAGMAALWRGRWEEARDRAQVAVGLEQPGFCAGWARSSLVLCECYLNHKDVALALLDDREAGLPRPGRLNTAGAWHLLLGVIEGLAVVGERDAAAKLYPCAREAIETGTVVSWYGHHLLQTVAGIAAACGQHWDAAQAHYETALTQAHDLPHKIAQPEVRRWYAQMLLDRDAPGNRDKARTLLGEAIDQYRTTGMPKHLAMAEGMLKKV